MSGADETGPSQRATWRLRLGAWCMALVAVAFIQDPGRVVTDTKLDLTVDPVGFLGRALHLWDPNGAFGQVQNQAYGYLFPMGPFFAGCDLLGLPPWVVQRLWWALIFVVAFLGVVKLSGVMGIGAGRTRIAAGVAFALSPRLLSVIGPSSIEVWPSAVAPWVLVPLVIGIRRGDPRRMAAWSAVAVACVGGVNAAATFAVVPLAALWLLMAPRGPRRRSLMLWWPPLVAMGTMWWLLPLALLGRYSPPFLDYIESADNTTFAATLFDALRGTTDWVPYVDADSVAGNDFVTQPLLIANLTVLLCFGVLGLARADLPHRRFLVTGLVAGVVLVTMGHAGSVQGLGADSVQDLLDGVLAPLRNTHKLDVLVRLPLVLGLCHAVTVLTRRRAGDPSSPRPRLDVTAVGAAALACAALVGAVSPAWSGTLANRASFTEVPGYWRQAASWLDERGTGRTLLTPASGFGDYVWGKTADEPLQALASSPWAVRNLIPLAPGGNIEMLDAISDQLATGRGSAGLAAFLRRAGIGTLVVRHDLNRRQDIVPPDLVRQTLESTPGMRRVATFGPQVGGGPTLRDEVNDRDVFVDAGWQAGHPALEVYELADSPSPTRIAPQPESATPVLVGDADGLLALDKRRVTNGLSVVMAKDADRSTAYGSTILTDGNRRQESSFGTVNHQRSASLTVQERYSSKRAVHRYDEEALQRWTTTPELRGARSIASSSSQAAVGASPHIDQAASTWAAFDGDPTTSWRPSLLQSGREAWVEVAFDGATDVGRATITLDLPQGESRTLTVTTQDGPRGVRVQGSRPVTVEVGTVRSLRVSGRSTVAKPLAIADVSMSGRPLSRPLVLPSVPDAWGAPSRILLQSGTGYADGCATFAGVPRCSATYFSEGEDGRTIDRELDPGTDGRYRPSLRVAPIGGEALTALLQEGRLSSIAASSQQSRAAAAGPLAAADGDTRTGWVADEDDVAPALTLSWVGERRVDALRVRTSSTLAASTPREVRLTFSDGSSTTRPVEDGRVRFDPVTTSTIRVQVTRDDPRYSVDFSGGVHRLPVGVSEIGVPDFGGFPVQLDDDVRTFACGSGPVVTVDGQRHDTAVRASPRQLASGAVVGARVCEPTGLRLHEGTNRVTITGTDAVRPVDLLLTREDAAAPAPTGEGELLVTTHNANPGWSAEQGGRTLESVVVNGWQQGWVDPDYPSGGPVTTRFVPSGLYTAGLTIGGVLAVGLIIVALLRPSPRRAALPEGHCGARRGGALVVVALAAFAFVAGPVGLAVGALGIVLPYVVGRRVPSASAWLVTVPVAVAGLVYVLRPWGSPDTWAGQLVLPQLLVVVTLGCLVSGVVEPSAFLKRRNGISTKR